MVNSAMNGGVNPKELLSIETTSVLIAELSAFHSHEGDVLSNHTDGRILIDCAFQMTGTA